MASLAGLCSIRGNRVTYSVNCILMSRAFVVFCHRERVSRLLPYRFYIMLPFPYPNWSITTQTSYTMVGGRSLRRNLFRWNPSCYMVQRHGRLLQCKKLGSMAATQVCSGWCSTLHGGIGSGMRSSMEISLESLQKSGREDFEWQDTVSDTLNWLQATSFCGNRRRDELHEAASL